MEMQTIIILLIAPLIIIGLIIVLLLPLIDDLTRAYIDKLVGNDDIIKAHLDAINQRLLERKIDLEIIKLDQDRLQNKTHNKENL